MNTTYTHEDIRVTASGIDQRRETRTKRDGIVEIMTLGLRPRVLSGIVHDVSKSGLCIYLRRRLAKDTIIVTTLDNRKQFGSVRYSLLVPEGIKTGIQIVSLFD